MHITDLPATEGPTTAEGLFVTPVSPLRNRFRPSASRRGSKGWSSFTSIPGRGGVGGVGGAGGGRGVLANMFTVSGGLVSCHVGSVVFVQTYVLFYSVSPCLPVPVQPDRPAPLKFPLASRS